MENLSLIRGRQIISYHEAVKTANSERELLDYGVNFSGVLLPSSVSPTHFCVVGGVGSGKTTLLRLMMQSVLPLIGMTSKSKTAQAMKSTPKESDGPSIPLSSPSIYLRAFIIGGISIFLVVLLSLTYESGNAFFLVPGLLSPFLLRPLRRAQFVASPELPPSSPSTRKEPQEGVSSVAEKAEAPEINHGHRALIYDAKQDMISVLHGMGLNSRVIILNPFDKRCVAWDIAKDIDEPIIATEIASILIPSDEKSTQKFFSNAARIILGRVFIALMRVKPGEWTLRDAILVMKSKTRLVALLESVPETRSVVEQYFSKEETALDIMAELATNIDPLEHVAAAWSNATEKVSLKEWSESESILVLGSNYLYKTTLDAINRVIFKRLTQIILSQSESRTRRTWFFLDEARELGKLDGLNDLLFKGRSKGACVVIAFQDIQGMKVAFGEKEAEEVTGLCANKAILKLDSPATAKWASELFGEYEFYEEKLQTQTSVNVTTGLSLNHALSKTFTFGRNFGQGTTVGGGWPSFNRNEGQSMSDASGANGGSTLNSSVTKGHSITHNKERMQKAAILPSEFLSLPIADYDRGMTGYYIVPSIGAYRGHLPGSYVRASLCDVDVKNSNEQPRLAIDQVLVDWNDEEEIQLIRVGNLEDLKFPKRRSENTDSRMKRE